MQGRGAGGGVKRAPERLAVDCHHALAALGKALHELGEAGPELLGVEQTEHPAEGVVAGHAVRQGKELPQEAPFSCPNSAMSAQLSPPLSTAHRAIIKTSQSRWRSALPLRGSSSAAKAAANLSMTPRLQACGAPNSPDHLSRQTPVPKCDSPDAHVSWLDPRKTRRITVVGSRKMAVYDDLADERLRIYDCGVERAAGRALPHTTARSPTVMGDIFSPQIAPTSRWRSRTATSSSASAIARPRRPRASGIAVVAVLEAIDRSLSTGTPFAVDGTGEIAPAAIARAPDWSRRR